MRKCIGQSVYMPPRRRLAGIRDLFRERRAIVRDLDWLLTEADSIALPRGMMCGALSNVKPRGGQGGLDYEFMGPGQVGFDCAYLLTSLEKIVTCPEATLHIGACIHAVAFAGSERHGAIFAVLNRVLTTISRSVYGQWARAVAARSGLKRPAAGAVPPQRAGS